MPNEAFTDLDRAKRLDSDLARNLDALQVRLERRNEAFADNETRLLGLVQTRNQITHIYRAEFAAAVLAELPQHLATLRELHAHAARRLA